MNTPDVRPVGDLPYDIGKTVARELSEASYVTGTDLVIDGGFTL